MAFDGIVAKAICFELKNIIGYKIDKVFQPDKNTVIIELYGKGTNFNVLASIDSKNCRLNLTTNHWSNPQVAPNFCMLLRKYLIGLKVKNIYTIDLERIVFIELENLDNPNKPIYRKLVIELMGKHSNIILLNENDTIIDSLRHTNTLDNSLRDIYPTASYIFPKSDKKSIFENTTFDKFYETISLQNDLNTNDISTTIVSTFNGISFSFIQSILNSLENKDSSRIELYRMIHSKIMDIINSIDYGILNSLNFTQITLDNLKKDYALSISDETNDNNLFRLNSFIDNFYFSKETEEKFKNTRNTLFNLILSSLKKYKKRLENIENKISECNDMDKYRIYGELITANLYRIPNQNISSIKLENYYDENKLINIPLDKKYSPHFNAKKYFKKYTKLKNAMQIVNIQKQETLLEINYIESIVYELENCKNIPEIQYIYDEISENIIFKDTVLNRKNNSKNTLKNKKKKNTCTISFNPLKFDIDEFQIYVGRNNKENDYLTTKFALKNDLWFHTKDIHGSHVILKVPNPNENIPHNVIVKCATLAVMHSKAKGSSNVPVDYCKVQFVKKPNGSKPGMVTYSNNKTLWIN